MADHELRGMEEVGTTRFGERLDILDRDMDIMERHAAELTAVEETIQGDMKKWDREYKDSHFHSVPRARKHQR